MRYFTTYMKKVILSRNNALPPTLVIRQADVNVY